MQERRQERRLRYHWPVWVRPDHGQDTIINGHMLDINSHAASFMIKASAGKIYPNQQLLARFEVPRFREDGSMDVEEFARWGQVVRIHRPNGSTCQVVLRFHQVLPFRPGHQPYHLDRDLVLV